MMIIGFSPSPTRFSALQSYVGAVCSLARLALDPELRAPLLPVATLSRAA